jgi:HAMP domain-containing protein
MKFVRLRTREEKAKGIALYKFEVKVPQELGRKLREIAAEEGLPLSGLVRRQMQRWLKSREAENQEGPTHPASCTPCRRQ